jgi:nitroimidazol reductase NimA-like FMN-containing flavoprotein (pyridoxamine 5'-phosphate oxidase superfamily)
LQQQGAAAPVAGRPHVPPGYGIAETPPDTATYSWERTENALAAARNYWVSSAGPDGRPHAAPVWAIWQDGALNFSTDRRSRKGRNLAANPEAILHLESGDDVVILEGRVEEVTDPALRKQLSAVYEQKYNTSMEPEGEAEVVMYSLRPRLAHTWLESDFVSSAVRWRFPGDGR